MRGPSRTEICGLPANGGECTMPKGHYAKYHRHRLYQKVEWVISTTMGEVLEKGNARVPMNYAITRQFDKHDRLVITLVRSQDGHDPDA
jgi:hypothetical protein